MKKRILSLVLCLALVLTLLPAAVFAAGGKITTITVNVPYDLTAGSEMPFDSSLLTVGDPDLYSAYLWAYSWTGADGVYMPDEYTTPCFEGGETYTLTVLIVAKDGVTGLDDDTAPYLPVFINGERAKFNPACSPELAEAPGKTVYAYMIDVQCPYTNVINLIDVYGFVPPTPGAKPCGFDDLSVPENAPYHIGAAFWVRYKGDPATSGAVNMEEGELFEAGSTYYMNLAIYANDGYTFSTGGDFTWRFNGSAFNGYADETYSYILSPKEAQFYSADLTAEARHIDRIDIEGLGGFYQGATVQSAIKNVTVSNAEGYTFVIEPDLCVTRYSDNTYIDRNTLFMADESYRATFLTYPDPGWTIDGDTVWTINGSAANVYYAAAGSGYWYVKSEVFPSLERTELDRIDIYGYTIPQVGQRAGDMLTVYVVGDLYEITDAYWFCDTRSCRMEADDIFEAGDRYSVCVVVKPCDPAFTIGSDTEFYLNSGYFPMGIHGAKSDGISYYVWTETMEASASDNIHVVSWYLEPDDEYPVTGVEVEDGEVFGSPAEPAKDGYIFGGWYLNRSCTIPYDPTAPIHADTDLFPLWIPETDPGKTAITAVDAQIPVPVGGQAPATRGDVTLTSTPKGAPLWVDGFTWFYWEEKIPGDNKWYRIDDPDFVFGAGEQYAVDIFVRTEDGSDYVFDTGVVGTVNGQPSDEEYDTVYQSATSAYLSYVWTAQEPDPCEGYTDINRGSWYHEAADFVISRGLMGSTKTDALTFEPNTPCTRSMIVMLLYNLAGNPAVEYEAKFPDVPAGQWYTDAVMWAYKNDIVAGYDNGLFAPNDKVTREQMAVVLKEYADSLGKDTSKTADLSVFPDANKVTWSKDYICWAVAENLISGKAQDGKTYLDPQGVATRAEVAALIQGFVENILETMK